jgi:hypothetical protein
MMLAIGCSDEPATENGNSAAAGSAGNSSSIHAPAAIAGAGCGRESFGAIYREIFADNLDNSCTSATCHGREVLLDSVGNLDLSTPDIAYHALVGRKSDGAMCAGKLRVKVGDAQGSLLLTKLRDDTVECGVLMPAGSGPIDDASLMRIADWINGGACNN